MSCWITLIISRGSGRLVLRPEETDVAALCRDLIGELRRSNPARHALTFTASGDCERVRVDPRLLRQILTNLITNAIKYSPAEGTVTVDVTCDEEATVLTVTDEGIGIPEEDQGRLFEPFHRAENAANIKGTGLGLAIVKQSVDLHRGWIGSAVRRALAAASPSGCPRSGRTWSLKRALASVGAPGYSALWERRGFGASVSCSMGVVLGGSCGTGLVGGAGGAVVPDAGEQDDLRFRQRPPDLARRLHPVDARHEHVHQHHVRLQSHAEPDGLFPCGRFPHQFKLIGCFEQDAQPVTHHLVVIDDHDPDHDVSAMKAPTYLTRITLFRT